MSAERIFRAIADVGDDLVARAEKEAKHQPSAWLRWGALAACCVLVIGLAALALPRMGFGAKSEAAMDTAAPAAQYAVTEEMPAEAPAPDRKSEPSMAEAPAEKAAAAEPETQDAPQAAQTAAMLPLLARDCAKIELRFGGASVTITERAEVDAVMDALRALPLAHEEAEARGETLTLYLYAQDAQAYYAFVELPLLRVASAEEYEAGGEAAQDYCSFDADALYEALLARYFPES